MVVREKDYVHLGEAVVQHYAYLRDIVRGVYPDEEVFEENLKFIQVLGSLIAEVEEIEMDMLSDEMDKLLPKNDERLKKIVENPVKVANRYVACENLINEFDAPTGYVYIITSEENLQHSKYKIGMSKNYEDRFKSIQTDLSSQLIPVLIFKTHNMVKLEKVLHHKFSQERCWGEWFILSSDDLYLLAREYDSLIIKCNKDIVGTLKE